MADTTNANGGMTQTLASAYHTATTSYNHLMEPIHQINEYVAKKNEYDAQFSSGSLDQSTYDSNVSSLQTEYFGDDAKKLSIANKFEAVQDWEDAHGITNIKESVFAFTGRIKDAFAKTSVGQKFEDIKLAAAEMGDTKEGPSDKKSVTHDEAWYKGEDLPPQVQEADRQKVIEARNSARADAALSGITATTSMDNSFDVSTTLGV